MSDFDPAELNRRDQDRMRSYKELLDFYQGVQWDGRERRGDKRLTFNYARVFIEKVMTQFASHRHLLVSRKGVALDGGSFAVGEHQADEPAG